MVQREKIGQRREGTGERAAVGCFTRIRCQSSRLSSHHRFRHI
jgi:hypothetical protein